MIEIGKLNSLQIIKVLDFGAYLDGADLGEILLPLKELPADKDVGDQIEVFICYDSEDRLIASTLLPKAMVGDFALLEVVALERIGVFLDWGLPKDLFLPFAEKTRDLKIGEEVLVFLYLDKTQRISASMRLEKNLKKTAAPAEFKVDQEVELLMFDHTDLGFKAIVNGTHQGMIFENEVFQTLSYGQKLKGYIKNIREDGKLDLKIQKPGTDQAKELAPRILEHLQDEGGFLPINDKTSAETIYQLFGVSKKKYKIALGGLYKQRKISVSEDGISLVTSQK